MAAEPSGRVRACFELKRTTFPLFSLLLRTIDLADLQKELQARLGDAPEVFDQDLLVLNLSAVSLEEGKLDFTGLLRRLRGYGRQPIGVHGGSDAQMAAAARAGLVPTPEVSAAGAMARAEGRVPVNAPVAAEPGAGQAARVDGGRAGGTGATGQRASRASAGAAQPAEAPEPVESVAVASSNTVLIDKPLRSGQRVYAQNADLVMLETVNFGAEILADGNIHVYAPLRGRAIAGARGKADARIFTTCLDPQLIAIDGIYRTIDTPLPDNVAGKPAQIRRVGDSLLIEPL